MIRRGPRLARAGIGAAIGLGTALAAAATVLAFLDVDDLDIALFLTGPLVIINTVVAAFASNERLRIVAYGSLGTGTLYVLIALPLAIEGDPFGILAVSGVSPWAAAIAWGASIGVEHLVKRRRRRRILAGRCIHCGYDCAGLKVCPECGREGIGAS